MRYKWLEGKYLDKLILDRYLRQEFLHNAHGWCSCIIFGDFGQLPPVMD